MIAHKISRCFLIVSLLLCSVALQAQEYTKVVVNGKEFYQYKVEKSEGFYSIGKKFSVSQEEILLINPDLKDGLKAEQLILIPIKTDQPAATPVKTQPQATATTAATTTVSSSLPPSVANGTIEHIVEKKETVYSISRLYHVSVDTIYKYNPESVDKLKKGSTIKFPVSSVNRDEIKKQTTDKEYNLHTVVEQETLYGISRQHNVAVEELMNLNPELRTRMIKPGDVLKISLKSAAIATDVPATETRDTLEAVPVGQTTVKIAFMLPFMLDSEKRVASSERFFDFYQGALIAIDSLKKMGIPVEIYTYDTGRTAEKLNKALASPELKSVHLIIGPAYTDQIKPIAEFAKANKIKLLIPFSSRTDATLTNEYVYQFNASQDVLNKEAVNIAGNAFKDKNIIILKFREPVAPAIKSFSDSITKGLNAKSVPYTEKIIPNDSIHIYSVDKWLDAEKENIVILVTTNANTISKLMPSLNKTKKEFSLFGFHDWTQLTSGQEEIFSHDTYICSPFFIDFQDKTTRKFFANYLNTFGNEKAVSMPYYNLLGYDITFYFVNGINKYGNSPEQHMNQLNVTTLQSGFNFEQVNEKGGYVNKNLFLVKYKGNTKQKVAYSK